MSSTAIMQYMLELQSHQWHDMPANAKQLTITNSCTQTEHYHYTHARSFYAAAASALVHIATYKLTTTPCTACTLCTYLLCCTTVHTHTLCQQCDDLIYELGRSLRSTFAVTMLLGIEERLMAYAEGTENDTPTSMDPANFKWRNG
jgi:uncharacterized ferredoxin-like protein